MPGRAQSNLSYLASNEENCIYSVYYTPSNKEFGDSLTLFNVVVHIKAMRQVND